MPAAAALPEDDLPDPLEVLRGRRPSRWNVLLAFVAGALSVGVAWLAVVSQRDPVPPEASLRLEPEIRGDELLVRGLVAGLPDGTVLDFVIRRHEGGERRAVAAGREEIRGGELSAPVDISDWPDGTFELEVAFRSAAQPRDEARDFGDRAGRLLAPLVAPPAARHVLASERFRLVSAGRGASPASGGGGPLTVRVASEMEVMGPPMDERLALENAGEISDFLTRYLPQSARRSGEGRALWLAVKVGGQGRAEQALVEFSSRDADLDGVALDAASLMRFSRPVRDGSATEAWVRVLIEVQPDSSR